MPNLLDKLQQQLGYQFNDESLLNTALTHRSFSSDHNERFEFLGDSLVNMLVAELLFESYPDIPEGKLTQQRAMLVKGETLAEIAQSFNVGEYLHLGVGEIKTGGDKRASILADALEAIIGAIYLDSSFTQCRDTVRHWYDKRAVDVDALAKAKDAKTRLQEIMQAKGKALPVYKTVEVSGQQHSQKFVVSCRVSVLPKPTQGEALSKKMAEQMAAENALAALGESNE